MAGPVPYSTVHGIPQPKGSMRAITHRYTGRPIMIADNRPTMRHWEGAIQGVVQGDWDGPPLEGPVWLVAIFTFLAPKSMSKRNPKTYVDVKPDLDKLLRTLKDALKGIAYRDDQQVTVEMALKVYGTESGLRIALGSLTEGTGSLTDAMLRALPG